MAGSDVNIVAISVGNTRTQAATFVDDALGRVERWKNADFAPMIEGLVAMWRDVAGKPSAAIVIASVNDETADALERALVGQLSIEVYRIGEDLPVPIGQQLDPETMTGADRLLNAAAAYDKLKQACVIVDAGTAVTIDFVDGQGTFHGGAIAPGARMQLRAMHEHTSALPEIEFARPDDEAFGRNTAQAMLQGVYHGIRGMVQRLTERYAEAYEAFPVVVATGGDAQTLFENDELIDRIVPELTLLGIAAAARHALGVDGERSS